MKRKSVSELVKDLKDDYWLARSRAAETLGQLGADAEEAVPALCLALNDDHREVRRDAADALAMMGSVAREAATALVTALHDPEMRDSVHRALVAIGAAAIPHLIGALSCEGRGRHAELVLLAVGEPAVDDMLRAVESNNETVRSRTISLISSLAPSGNKRAVEAMVRVVVNADETRVNRFLAATSLEKMDPAAAARLRVKSLYANLFGDG